VETKPNNANIFTNTTAVLTLIVAIAVFLWGDNVTDRIKTLKMEVDAVKQESESIRKITLNVLIEQANAHVIAGGSTHREKALQLYRVVLSKLPYEQQRELDKELLEKATKAYENQHYEDAVRIYQAIFDNGIPTSRNNP